MIIAAPPLKIDKRHATGYVQRLGHPNIAGYQDWFGLPERGGIIGPATSTHLLRTRCGVPDRLGIAEAQWPRTCVEVPVAYDFDVIDKAMAERCWTEALNKWNSVCGIKLFLVEKLADGKIWATDGPLPGGTLAWSYLANDRCDTRLEQRYDTTEVPYTFEFLTKIIFHEVGHAIGLEHTNDQRDIMYPSISNKPWADYPSAGDISRVVQRYGEPKLPPPPPPPPPPPGPPEEWQLVDGYMRVLYKGHEKLVYFEGKRAA